MTEASLEEVSKTLSEKQTKSKWIGGVVQARLKPWVQVLELPPFKKSTCSKNIIFGRFECFNIAKGKVIIRIQKHTKVKKDLVVWRKKLPGLSYREKYIKRWCLHCCEYQYIQWFSTQDDLNPLSLRWQLAISGDILIVKMGRGLLLACSK
jgi:hypothetical protein